MKLTVVLVGVEHPGNLGAVARAMKNFGIADLVLVSPLCDPDDSVAKNRAKWANDILERARVTDIGVLREFDLVIGTTAQLGNDYNLVRTPLFPAQVAARLVGVAGKVAVVFGRESDGLTNGELKQCDFTLTIPANPAYPVLNLSHAVAVVLSALTAGEHERRVAQRYPLVRAAEKAELKKLIDNLLDTLPFQTAEKRETQRVLWQRLIGKSFLTQREAMALLGFFKKVQSVTFK